ncbi:hypothetical protein DACRYDRAFT_103080 [Dacryopinax primogenitus]|uniref:SET domain-containing protein n=1 Tax=Dacryopinax primogenitus (strain DJM 731) TaxID=1858805 RepID=M5GFB9_DACPD|nr:uncharacterized protein DACRYDRAFT_103080 [Dacryopinax primogenitus]EJU06132.1 hypothetical protein DACRYDRAFT_103080 [Dacryopinax primogenitus]
MNVVVRQIIATEQANSSPRKVVLIASKDFQHGEEIYKEHPVIAQLDIDLEGTAQYCSHCFRALQSGKSITPPEDLLGSAYCSTECQMISDTQSQNLLFGRGPLVPNEAVTGQLERTEAAEAERRAYQQAFVDFLKACGWTQVLLVGRFCARHVSEEVKKLAPLPASLVERSALPEPITPSPEYTFYDHVERLKFLEIQPTEMVMLEHNLLQDVLKKAVAGLEEVVEINKYLAMKGRIAYNSIGVAFDGGRDDRADPKGRVETWEWSRTPVGTERQIGSALYRVSSYLTHSCSPSVRLCFKGTNELHLIANRAISKGEHLTMSYTSIEAKNGEAPEVARRQRRIRLARGWRFACECEACTGKKSEVVGTMTAPDVILEKGV